MLANECTLWPGVVNPPCHGQDVPLPIGNRPVRSRTAESPSLIHPFPKEALPHAHEQPSHHC